MTTNSRNDPIIQAVDKETICTMASLPFEKQVFVKGVILGLCSQADLHAAAQAGEREGA